MAKFYLFPSHKNKFFCLSIIILSCYCCQNFGYAINVTESLPYKFFIIHQHVQPKAGDYILFKAPQAAALPSNSLLTKKVLGEPGDSVAIKDRQIYINDQWVATAKTHSLQGEPLLIGPQGVLRKGQYYVGTSHNDSFDSRYQRIGWIEKDLIIGVAYPLW